MNDNPLEKDIEKKVRLRVEDLGGIMYKFVSPGNRGVPDRIVLLPDACFGLIEFKRLGRVPDPLQEWQIKRIRKLGFQVGEIDNVDDGYKFINGLFLKR